MDYPKGEEVGNDLVFSTRRYFKPDEAAESNQKGDGGQ
jgi:hypothetical protein